MDRNDDVRVVAVVDGNRRNLVDEMRRRRFYARQGPHTAIFGLKTNGAPDVFDIPDELQDEVRLEFKVNLAERYGEDDEGDFAVIVCGPKGERLLSFAKPESSFVNALFSYPVLVTVTCSKNERKVEISQYELVADTNQVSVKKTCLGKGEPGKLPFDLIRFDEAASAAVEKAKGEALTDAYYVQERRQ